MFPPLFVKGYGERHPQKILEEKRGLSFGPYFKVVNVDDSVAIIRIVSVESVHLRAQFMYDTYDVPANIFNVPVFTSLFNKLANIFSSFTLTI